MFIIEMVHENVPCLQIFPAFFIEGNSVVPISNPLGKIIKTPQESSARYNHMAAEIK